MSSAATLKSSAAEHHANHHSLKSALGQFFGHIFHKKKKKPEQDIKADYVDKEFEEPATPTISVTAEPANDESPRTPVGNRLSQKFAGSMKRINSEEMKAIQANSLPIEDYRKRIYKKPDEVLGINTQEKPCRRSLRSKESLDLEKMLGPPNGCTQQLFDELASYELGDQNDSFDEYSNDDFFEDLQFYYANFTSKNRVSGAFPKLVQS